LWRLANLDRCDVDLTIALFEPHSEHVYTAPPDQAIEGSAIRQGKSKLRGSRNRAIERQSSTSIRQISYDTVHHTCTTIQHDFGAYERSPALGQPVIGTIRHDKLGFTFH
jgi:hypothetical protein